MKRLLLIIPLLFSCQPKKDDKTLKISMYMNPATLDPRKSGDLVSCTTIFLLYNGLMRVGFNGAIEPSLAKSYEVSADKMHYTFHLRDAYWSDGSLIAAKDFEVSWKKILDPDFPTLVPQLLYCIKNAEKVLKRELPVKDIGVRAIGEKTLEVDLEYPAPYFLHLTAFCLLFPTPAHIDDNPNWAFSPKTIPSSGPYRLAKWELNSRLLLVKNERYWDREHIEPKKIEIHIIDNEDTALQMFYRKELDWVGTPISPIPIDSYAKLFDKLILIPVGGTTFVSFNLEAFPFQNKLMRKAFSLAIDRKAIVENITQLHEPLGNRIIPPILMDNEDRYLIESNEKKAKESFEMALKELKIKKKDLKFTFLHSKNFLYKKIAEALQDKWNKTFGIDVKLQQDEKKVFLDKIHRHEFQFMVCYWLAQYDDPMNILERFKYKSLTKNYSNWESSKYIDLLNQISEEKDLSLRKDKILEAEDLFIEEMPLTPIYHHFYVMLFQPNIKGPKISKIGDIHFEYVQKNKN